MINFGGIALHCRNLLRTQFFLIHCQRRVGFQQFPFCSSVISRVSSDRILKLKGTLKLVGIIHSFLSVPLLRKLRQSGMICLGSRTGIRLKCLDLLFGSPWISQSSHSWGWVVVVSGFSASYWWTLRVKWCCIQLCTLPCALDIQGINTYLLNVVRQVYFKLKNLFKNWESRKTCIFSRLKMFLTRKSGCWQ